MVIPWFSNPVSTNHDCYMCACIALRPALYTNGDGIKTKKGVGRGGKGGVGVGILNSAGIAK